VSPDVLLLHKPFTTQDLLNCLRDAILGHDTYADPAEVREAPERTNVFVVDQDPGLLEWLETGLQLRGMSCCCAPDIASAIGLMGKQTPHVLFLDGDVPGSELRNDVAALREGAGSPELPIYVLSGAPNGPANRAGVQGVIRKPFTIREIVSIVRTIAPVAPAVAKHTSTY
jgi:DNA-binding response OmpR family regulator